MRHAVVLASLLLACGSPVIGADAGRDASATPVVGETHPIAALVGRFATPAPGQSDIGFYAADLGWSFVQGGQIEMLFGDSWAASNGTATGSAQDDSVGQIALADFPDGDTVDAFVAAHPAPAGEPSWHAAAPPLVYPTDASHHIAPIHETRDGVLLRTSSGYTPGTGFANAQPAPNGAAFGIFYRNAFLECASGACGQGFDCDPGLGLCGPLNDLSMPCVLGTTDCICVPVSGGGLCIDRTSSVYDDTARGRTAATVAEMEVGNAAQWAPQEFSTRVWATNRFTNVTSRTVDDFDPTRAGGLGNRYAPADGVAPENEKVFVWGRPGFVGLGAAGRDTQLYLMYVDMPAYSPTASFAWTPQYFSGLSADGTPQFSTEATAAAPLDLDSTIAGVQPEEPIDIVDQHAIAYIPPLNQWVMIYGGDVPPILLLLVLQGDSAMVRHDPERALVIRFADQPWGPWSPPQAFFQAGLAGSGGDQQYGPGGILRDPSCTAPACAPSETPLAGGDAEPGVLYGPNIVDVWTEDRGAQGVDLYWNVSTWDPYQVVLMRSRLPPR